MTIDIMRTQPDEDMVATGDLLNADMAEEQKAVRIVARLPYEVQISILERVVSTKLLLYLLECSHGWKKVVEDNSTFWKRVTILENDPLPQEDLQRIFGPSISRHITDLNLFVDSPCYNLLLDTMAAGNFRHLQRLTVKGDTFGSRGQSVRANRNHDRLFSGLRGVADTLLELAITTNASETNDFLPFANVLSICPKLESLAYKYHRQPSDEFFGFGEQDFAPISAIGAWADIPPNAPLKAFKLSVNDTPSTFDMVNFLVRCPNLLSIELDQAEMRLVAAIHDNCKKVQRLDIRNAFHYEAVIDHDNDANWTWKLKSFHADDGSWVAGYFMPHIRRSAHTLESLGFEQQALYTSSWQNLESFSLPNIRHLQFNFDPTSASDVLALLKHFSATVESLHLSSCDLDDSALTECIASLPSLRKLELADMQEESAQGIREIFRRIANHSSGSLTTVILGYSNRFASYGVILPALASINSLTTIHIQHCQSITNDQLNQFCESLSTHPRVETLELTGLGAVEDNTLEYIAGISNLRTVGLHYVPNVTEEGIQAYRNRVATDLDHTNYHMDPAICFPQLYDEPDAQQAIM